MLTAAFVLVVVTMIVAHHFLIEGRSQRAAESRSSAAGPLTVLLSAFPADVQFQPSFTWSRTSAGGEQLVGVHPLLLDLVGSPCELEAAAGYRAEKGSPLIRLHKGDRSLAFRSPISGRITETRKLIGRADPNRSDWQDWVCRIEPDEEEGYEVSWLSGDRALEWTRHVYAEIRDHLIRGRGARGWGYALADGGELPWGVLGDLETWEWDAFQEAFLDS